MDAEYFSRTSSSTSDSTPPVGYTDNVSDGHEFSHPKRQRLDSAQSKESRQKSLSGLFQNSWNLPVIEASSRENEYAHCKLCRRDFSVTRGGHNDAKHHCESSGHQKKHSELQSNSNLTSFVGESSISHSSKVISAEIAMAQFIALHNLPLQAADHLSDLVSSMLPNSKIAAAFSSKHTKTKCSISNGLDPYFKDPIVKSLKTTPFNLMCDESSDNGDKWKLLSILVRFFASSTELIITHYLETVAITYFTAEGIFSSLKDALQKYNIPLTNILSFTSDTCNVMKGSEVVLLLSCGLFNQRLLMCIAFAM